MKTFRSVLFVLLLAGGFVPSTFAQAAWGVIGDTTLGGTVVDGFGCCNLTCAPVIGTVTASPSSLTNRTGQLVAVTIAYTATDSSGVAPTCSLGVTSNEAIVQGTDFLVVDAHTVNLKDTLSRYSKGRTYTITVTCVNAANNSAAKTVTVRVPR